MAPELFFAVEPGRALTSQMEPSFEVTMADYGDRCTASAQVLAVKPPEMIITLCQHHATEHRATLVSQGWSLSSDVDDQATSRQI